jgi:hypothetical protein
VPSVVIDEEILLDGIVVGDPFVGVFQHPARQYDFPESRRLASGTIAG